MTWAVDALATARLVRLVQRDRAGVPVKRELVGQAYRWTPPRGQRHTSTTDPLMWAALDPDPPLAVELLDCPWCLSVWVGALVVAARRCAPRLWDPVARMLAASMISGLAATVYEVEHPAS